MEYTFGSKKYDLTSRTFIMGIFNITPDSFSDGGKYFDSKINSEKILADALRMETDGADFFDIGGESTRPGSESISLQEEIDRVIPVINLLKQHCSIPISIDTYKSKVAEEALKEGAVIVNDISGFKFDPEIVIVTAKYNASCILMHIQGTPKDMQKDPKYDDVVYEVSQYLKESASIAMNAGIEQIILDPGIGFGKDLKHNLSLIKNISSICDLGFPVLIGTSRKSFMNKIHPTPMEERIEGSIASAAYAVINGASIVRTHDVAETKRAMRVVDAIKNTNN